MFGIKLPFDMPIELLVGGVVLAGMIALLIRYIQRYHRHGRHYDDYGF